MQGASKDCGQCALATSVSPEHDFIGGVGVQGFILVRFGILGVLRGKTQPHATNSSPALINTLFAF
jgi:hypothetical protein